MKMLQCHIYNSNRNWSFVKYIGVMLNWTKQTKLNVKLHYARIVAMLRELYSIPIIKYEYVAEQDANTICFKHWKRCNLQKFNACLAAQPHSSQALHFLLNISTKDWEPNTNWPSCNHQSKNSCFTYSIFNSNKCSVCPKTASLCFPRMKKKKKKIWVGLHLKLSCKETGAGCRPDIVTA